MSSNSVNPIAWARKLVALVIGGTLLLIGFALLFLPGPGTVVGGIGLAILATEFWWARWLFKHARERAGQLTRAVQNGMGRTKRSPDSQDDEA